MGGRDAQTEEPLLSGDSSLQLHNEQGLSPSEEIDAIGIGDEEEGQQAKGSSGGNVTVLLTTFIMLGDMLGLGSLTLPAVFARLGWAPALAVIAICVIGTLYSGRLFTLLALKVPGAKVFDDFGSSALGRWGRYAVYFTVYATIAGEPVVFHLTSTESLQQVAYATGITRNAAALIIAIVMLPLAQLRHVEDVSLVSVVGIAGMVLSLVVIALKLCITPRPADYMPPEIVHRPSDLSTPLVAFFDAVFTFGGQVNWVRYLMAMRYRAKFPLAVGATTAVMTGMYLLIGCVGYARLGQNFDHSKPVTSVLPNDAWTLTANAGLLAHCIVAYMINLNIWTHLVLHFVAPNINRPEVEKSARSRLAWAATSVVGIAYSCAVSVTFPFFSTVVAIIAALGDLAGAYALPALFVLALAASQLSSGERWLCRVLVPASLALSVVGVYSSLAQLVKEFRGH